MLERKPKSRKQKKKQSLSPLSRSHEVGLQSLTNKLNNNNNNNNNNNSNNNNTFNHDTDDLADDHHLSDDANVDDDDVEDNEQEHDNDNDNDNDNGDDNDDDNDNDTEGDSNNEDHTMKQNRRKEGRHKKKKHKKKKKERGSFLFCVCRPIVVSCCQALFFVFFVVLIVAALIAVTALLNKANQEIKAEQAEQAEQADAASNNNGNQLCKNKSTKGTRGMVSTTNSLATDAGYRVLLSGGNAFDAAIAIQLTLAVVQPQSTGLGGGLFGVLYSKSQNTVFALDGREEAPNCFTTTAFCRQGDCTQGPWPFQDIVTGGHPVGVPGVISSLSRLYTDFGSGRDAIVEAGMVRQSWRSLFTDAVQAAKTGFKMYESMYVRLMMNRERMLLFNATKKLFFTEAGDMPTRVGDVFVNQDLAATLELLSQDDSSTKSQDVFYRGEITQDIIKAATEAVNPTTGLSSCLSPSDFQNYSAVYRDPVRVVYRDTYAYYSMGMPSSGGTTMALALNILNTVEMQELEHNQAEYIHRLIDAQDIAFADRNTYMGDIDFIENPNDIPSFAYLTSASYARSRVQNLTSPLSSARSRFPSSTIPAGIIPRTTSKADTFGSSPLSPKSGTTHYVVSDRWGNVVSLTTTIEENFGSGVAVKGRGFLLNNELTDFTHTENDPITGLPYLNRPEGGSRFRRSALDLFNRKDSTSKGGKRPMSSMSPSLITRLSRSSSPSSSPPPSPSSPPSSSLSEDVYLALGSPGGSSIIGTVLNALIGILDSNLCIGDAVASPRIISKNSGPTQMELPLLNNTSLYGKSISVLRERNFVIEELITARPLGYVQVLKKGTDAVWEGVADSTRLPEATARGLN